MSERDPEHGALDPTITGTGAAAGPASATLERGATFGRYMVLARLGAGGMGVVYSAYDPELDRKVAVKILPPDAARDQSRLRREAQAMARVQHPNAIAVYDVGTFNDRVFVAMELVDGTTLAHWLEDGARSWREVVDVFLQAGRGLAAAHAVGLVHRDFKPANALIDHEGRVRVVDFGLARSFDAGDNLAEAGASPSDSQILHETITRAGALLGTPTYMSPEQFLGSRTDAKSDQFSFCVALYRALYGQRPFAGEDLRAISDEVTSDRLKAPPKDSRAPAWIWDVVMRGLSTNREERWPSMDALLAALSRDPARTRRRRLMSAAAVVALALAAVGLRALQRHESLVCRGAERKLDGVWDAARRSAVQASFAATGKSYADSTFRSVARALDAYARSWSSMHTDACEATRVRRDQSEELLDLRMECLGQRLQEMKAQVDLFTTADAKVVDNAVQMTSSLASVAGCADLTALRAPVRPPTDAATRARVDEVRKKVAQAKSYRLAGKYKEGLAIAAPSVQEARALHYRPLEADALLTLGTLQRLQGDYKPAEKSLSDATLAARAGRDAAAEAKAWAGLIAIATFHARYADGHSFGDHGFAALEALGGSDDEALSTLLGNLSHLVSEEGKLQEALDYRKRQLSIMEKSSGPDNPPLSLIRGYIGQLLANLGRYEEGERQIRQALAIAERQLGPDHPDVGGVALSLGYILYLQGRLDESLTYYRRCVAIWEKALGPDYPRLTDPLAGIADIFVIQHKYDEALAVDRRVIAVSDKGNGPGNPRSAYGYAGLADVFQRQGRYDEALASWRQALAIWEKTTTADDPTKAYALVGIGHIEIERHHAARALPLFERALAIADKGAFRADTRAQAEYELARALAETGGDHARARRLATKARVVFAAAAVAADAGPQDKENLAEIDAWLAAH